MSTADMPPSSWRYLASASNKLSSVKGYLSNSVPLSRPANPVATTDEQTQTWRAWATQKVRGKARAGQAAASNEILTLFPGWAARRYPQGKELALGGGEPIPFGVEAFVSGYAISCRTKEQASRSQRAFIRLAKGFASLPRISNPGSSTEELVNHLSTPVQASDEFQAQVLDQQLQRAKDVNSDSDSESVSDASTPPPPSSLSSYPSPTHPPTELNTPADVLQKLHYNLESRLQPFWSSTLPSRTVRLHLFVDTDEDKCGHEPLATRDVTTGIDGSFSARFRIDWSDLCHHPQALYIAYSERIAEDNLLVVAELLPPPPSTASSSIPQPSQTSRSTPPSPSRPQFLHSPSHSFSHSHPHLHTLLTTLTSLTSSLTSILTPTSTASYYLRVPITHSSIRVISDIDDTVKMSGVTEGARAVFHNVFVKELKDGVIPGMGEWYSGMWKRGVRFHYVSNGPFEYLSVLIDFFKISKLPPGSIKLKSYAGRSLLSGLLSTPAARKRAGVLDILDSFPDSRFILIGDSGEQDLELYADLARERPEQILAVFIRDAEETLYPPIDDPTGWRVVGAGRAGERFNSEPLLDYDASSSSTASSPTRAEDEHPTPKPRRQGQPTRTFSDTYAHARPYPSTETNSSNTTLLPNVGVVVTNRPLRDEPASDEEFPDTPKQQIFTSFPPAPPPKSTLTQYITTPPPPVMPLSIPPSTSRRSAAVDAEAVKRSGMDTYSPSHIHGHRHRHRYPKAKSARSTESTSTSSSSSYYKSSDPYSRLGSLSSFGGFGFGGKRGSRASTSADIGGSTGDDGGDGDLGYTRTGTASTIGSSSTLGSNGGRLTEPEKKRMELQMRVHRARTQMPSGVLLRVFRHPEECGEEVKRVLGEM